MQEPYWWYVLRVKQGKEHKVISEFTAAFENLKIDCEYEIFILESEQYYHNGKRIVGRQYKKRPVFPNHVFIATTLSQDEFIKRFSEFIFNSANIVKLLKYPNITKSAGSQGYRKNQYALYDEERIAMERRFPDHHCMGYSLGKIDGDKLTITLGPLVGKIGLISQIDLSEALDSGYDFVVRKIDRHHRTAAIESTMFNRPMPMTIALEVTEKNP